MYPHIFVDNITTGSTAVRCDCSEQCTPKGLTIESNTSHGNKLYYYDVENTSSSTRPLLYTHDSVAIGNWSQQVSQYYPICTSPRSMPFFDHPPIASPPPPYTPRQRRLTYSSDNSDQRLKTNELNEQKSGWELLIDAVDLSPNAIVDKNMGGCDSMETSTISYDEEREENLTALIECENEFANLHMLAEEAVKRIKLREQMEK